MATAAAAARVPWVPTLSRYTLAAAAIYFTFFLLPPSSRCTTHLLLSSPNLPRPFRHKLLLLWCTFPVAICCSISFTLLSSHCLRCCCLRCSLIVRWPFPPPPLAVVVLPYLCSDHLGGGSRGGNASSSTKTPYRRSEVWSQQGPPRSALVVVGVVDPLARSSRAGRWRTCPAGSSFTCPCSRRCSRCSPFGFCWRVLFSARARVKACSIWLGWWRG